MAYSYIKYKSIVQIFYIYKNSETDKHTLLYTTLVTSKEKLQLLHIFKDDWCIFVGWVIVYIHITVCNKERYNKYYDGSD